MLLEVRNLTKRFGGLTAVSDLSFGLDEGDIVGVIRPERFGQDDAAQSHFRRLSADRRAVAVEGQKSSSEASRTRSPKPES